MNEKAEQSRRRGKTGRITGLACATPAPVSFFRSRLALCVKGSMKLTTIIFLILMSMRSLAEQIEVIPDECGPLARGKLGVIFSLAPHGSRKLYFSEGNASELCPRMVKAKSITGYEIDYCEEYEPANINECGKIKFFKIVKFNYE